MKRGSAVAGRGRGLPVRSPLLLLVAEGRLPPRPPLDEQDLRRDEDGGGRCLFGRREMLGSGWSMFAGVRGSMEIARKTDVV